MNALLTAISKARGPLEVATDGLWVFYWPVLVPGDPVAKTGADAQGHITSQATIDTLEKKYHGQKLQCDLNHVSAPVPSVSVEFVKAQGDIEIDGEKVISGTLMGKTETDDENLAKFLRKVGRGLSIFGKGLLTKLDGEDEEEEPEEKPAPEAPKPTEKTPETEPVEDLMAVALKDDIASACGALKLQTEKAGEGNVEALEGWYKGLGGKGERFDPCVSALEGSEDFSGDPQLVCAYLSRRCEGKE